MVRACRLPAREPARAPPARRSPIAPSSFATASSRARLLPARATPPSPTPSSPASIIPVGPPPAITTAWSDTALALVDPPEHRLDVDDRRAVERLEVGHVHARA